MFPINFNFPYRKKDGSLITMEKALDGAGADLDLIDLDDVAITSPAEGDGLIYDNTAHKWKNIPIISRIVALFNAWKNNGAYNICPNEATSGTVNQITYTVNSNGTVTAEWSEAPTGNSPLLYAARGSLKLKAGVTYKLVGCPAGGGWSAGNFKYRVFIQDNTAVTDIQDIGNGAIFTAVEGHEYTVYITIAQHAGATGSLVFKPMVTTDLNATYDDYVEYAKTNRQLTGDALTANDVAFVKEAFNLQADSSKAITLTATVSLLVGVYGANGFMYLVHDNGGVYQIANSNDGITASLSTHTLTITNSGTHSYRTRLLELGQI